MMSDTKNKKEKEEKPKYSMWQNAAYMVSLAWKIRKSVLSLCSVLAVLGIASSLVRLYIAPSILARIENAAPLSAVLTTIAVFVLSLLLINALTSYFSTNTLFGRVEVRLWLVNAIHQKLSTTSYPNTEDTAVLKKLEKANSSVAGNNRATEAIWNTLVELVKNGIGFIIYLILLADLNPLLILVISLTAGLGYFVNKKIGEWGFRHREEEARYSKHLNYIKHKSEEVSLAKDIRIFGMKSWLEEIYDKTFRAYEAFISRGERVYIWINVIDAVLTLLRNGLAYAYLITITLQKGLPASEFLLYFAAVGGFTAWVTGLLKNVFTLHEQGLDITVLREFLETPELFKFENGEAIEPRSNQSYEIKLVNVSFRYPNAEKDTLHKINLTIRPGEKLAVVGLNGTGKTTLVKLICGFYDPTEGEVLLNNTNIKVYNRRDYYRHFTAVFQQFSMLEATLAENVAQSCENIDFTAVSDCLEKAGLTAKVNSLPDGLETKIGRKVYEDGIELSGGETQRLVLARALYKNAPIVVLDEPTAALDPIAENNIYQKYNEMTQGHTAIFISHRLASTRFCDRIILIKEGAIAEEGTHSSLMALGGEYAKMFGIQSKYYKEGGVFDEE